jgi:hypothetical protein
MAVFDSLAPQRPTPEMGSTRIKRTLAQTFHQIESSLAMVRQIMQRHGKGEIDAALGSDKAEVEKLYQALKAVVEQHKPNAKVAELTSSVATR